MPVPRYRDIHKGTSVSIVLKADQRTGRQVQGTVDQLLTRGDHPRGVKVRLSDGRIGRVQQLVSAPFQTASTSFQRYTNMNSENNPWASSTSQGNPYLSQPGTQAQGQFSQQARPGHAADYYGGGQLPNQNQGFAQNNQTPVRPAQNVQRTDNDNVLAQQSDGAAQLEHMQAYEASAPQTQEDRDQALLSEEFPNVDSSLIAALYSDSKSLSATKEMLQELAKE